MVTLTLLMLFVFGAMTFLEVTIWPFDLTICDAAAAALLTSLDALAIGPAESWDAGGGALLVDTLSKRGAAEPELGFCLSSRRRDTRGLLTALYALASVAGIADVWFVTTASYLSRYVMTSPPRRSTAALTCA